MQVKLQDCGCIALPDEVLSGLGLASGTVFEVEYQAGSRSFTLTAGPRAEGERAFEAGAACPVGDVAK
jgi:hypothetical protein